MAYLFFKAQLRYLTSDLRGDNGDGGRFAVDFDPLITAVGFGYRF